MCDSIVAQIQDLWRVWAGAFDNTVTLAVSGTTPLNKSASVTEFNVKPVAQAGSDHTVNMGSTVTDSMGLASNPDEVVITTRYFCFLPLIIKN